jgi:hypothetical protein
MPSISPVAATMASSVLLILLKENLLPLRVPRVHRSTPPTSENSSSSVEETRFLFQNTASLSAPTRVIRQAQPGRLMDRSAAIHSTPNRQ